MAAGIGTDKAAFFIKKLEAAHGTKLPPVFLLIFFCRFGSIHYGASITIFKESISLWTIAVPRKPRNEPFQARAMGRGSTFNVSDLYERQSRILDLEP
jgi:hypothetical protein